MKANNKLTKAIATNYDMLNDLCIKNCASVSVTFFVEVAGELVLQGSNDLYSGIKNARNLHDAGLEIDSVILDVFCSECFGITYQRVELRHADASKLLKTFKNYYDNL